jgi:hypothetical protein
VLGGELDTVLAERDAGRARDQEQLSQEVLALESRLQIAPQAEVVLAQAAVGIALGEARPVLEALADGASA